MDAAELVLRDAREEEIVRLETELEQLQRESARKYNDLVDDVESQGFRPSVDDSTSEARAKLKHFLKLKLPRQTMEMINECFSGLSLPPNFGGGDPVDKACTFWSGLLVAHMSAESGRMSEQGRQMLTALFCASPNGIS